MNLFINTISPEAILILFNRERKIIEKHSFIIKGNESSLLIPEIDKLLKKNNLDYKNLENIVVINGPGSFTGVRTTVLAANSINYIINKNMTALSYFDLFDKYPIIKSSSKRDCFIQLEQNKEVEIIENDKISEILKEKGITKAYGNGHIEDIEIVDNIDYNDIIKKLIFKENKKIEALYIKKPNIC